MLIDMQDLLKRSGVTDTELTVEDVEILMEVLILDGKVEQVSHTFDH